MATRRDSNQGQGQHVLLTGANGFVASYILLKLIERGFTVTATVRSQDKVDDILRTHPEWKGKANFAIVADFTSQQPFDEIFENAKVPFTFIIHAASPLKFDVQDIEKEMIEPATKGTSEMLKSALRHQGTHLKRFVLLGSAVSVLNSFEDMSREGRPYTEKDWNPVTAKHAIDRQDTVLGYNASKTQAEHAAWDFMEQNKPAFDLAVINPDIVIGPMIHPIDGPESINQTNRFAIASFIDGTHETIEDVRFPFYHFVDVRDVAQGAVDALTNPAAGGQRILLVSGLITPQLVVNTIRKHFPTLRDRVPKGLVGRILPEGVQPTDWSKNTSLNILSKGTPDEQGRWRHIELEQSIKDTVQSMIDLGLV